MAQSLTRSTNGSSRLLAAALAGLALVGAGGASAQDDDGASDAHARSHPIREGGHTVSPNPQSSRVGDPIPGIDITCQPPGDTSGCTRPDPSDTARAGDPIPDIDITVNQSPGGRTSNASGGRSDTPQDTDGDGLADPSDTARGGFKAGKALAETVKHNEQPTGMSGGPGDADGDGFGDAALDDSAAARTERNPQTGKEIK